MNTLPVPEVKELCQWESMLQEQVSNPAVFERMWNEVPAPRSECVVYEWPEGEVT